MKRTTRRGFIGTAIGVGAATAIGSCAVKVAQGRHGVYESHETHPVDQIFRDHNGWRIFYTGLDKIVQEVKYVENLHGRGGIDDIPDTVPADFTSHLNDETQEKGVVLIRDLEAEVRAYANVIHYTQHFGIHGWSDGPRTYVEVHLPPELKISPGMEAYGYPPPAGRKDSPMHEIR